MYAIDPSSIHVNTSDVTHLRAGEGAREAVQRVAGRARGARQLLLQLVLLLLQLLDLAQRVLVR